MKKAIVTGISGQDGAYLAKLLLSNNYKVFGIVRTNSKSFSNLEYLKINNDIEFVKCDLLNINAVENIINDINPDEIYNLAAKSSVFQS